MNPHREPGVSNFDRIVELECENATLRNRLAEKPKPKEPGLLRQLATEYETIVATAMLGVLCAVFAVCGKLVYKLVVWL